MEDRDDESNKIRKAMQIRTRRYHLVDCLENVGTDNDHDGMTGVP
jgi:hypothetical protein